jgi:hypothetical protein
MRPLLAFKKFERAYLFSGNSISEVGLVMQMDNVEELGLENITTACMR